MKKPKHFLIFKIIGFFGILVTVTGIIFLIIGFGDFETNNYLIGMFMFPFGIFISVFGLTTGFKPEISKVSTETVKYIQEENKEDLQDIMTTKAEIAAEAVTITANAVKDGLQNSIYCKHCGEKIDADSIFCRYCGGKQ